MDVSYTAYSSTGRVLKQQHYDNLPLTDGCLYESSIEPSSSTSVDFTLDGDAPENNFRFTDVPESAYFYEPVLWAVENGVTSGTSATKFSPYEGCTRGQVVTFLWRAAGCPEPESSYNPFSDVPSNAYYHDAVLWAAEESITTGTSRTRFEPNATVTRAQTVTFLWRWAGSPEPAPRAASAMCLIALTTRTRLRGRSNTASPTAPHPVCSPPRRPARARRSLPSFTAISPPSGRTTRPEAAPDALRHSAPRGQRC